MSRELLSSMRLRKKLITIAIIVVSIAILVSATALIIYSIKTNKVVIQYKNDENITFVAVDSTLEEEISPSKQIRFKIECSEGYEIDYIKANNTRLYPDENGIYTAKPEKKEKHLAILAKSKPITFTELGYTGTLEKTKQFDGEEFDPTGLTFIKYFSDSSSVEINNFVLELPILSINRSVVVSYGGKSVTIEGVTIVNSVTFDLENMGKFNENDEPTLKVEYKEENQIELPTEEDISVNFGKNIGALKHWRLKEVTESGNRVYVAEWNYFSKCEVELIDTEENATFMVSADILVSENTEKIKIVIGGKTFIPEITGFSLKKEIPFEDLNQNVSINSAGYKVNLYYDDENFVSMYASGNNTQTTKSFTFGNYYYNVYSNENGEIVIKKVLKSEFRIANSNVTMSQNGINFNIEVYDYITGEREDLNQSVRAYIYVGEYQISANIVDNHYIMGNLSFAEYTKENNLEDETDILFTLKMNFNGIDYTMELPIGETDLNQSVEIQGYYYSLKNTDDKLYITKNHIPEPEVGNITVNLVGDKIVIVGIASHVKSVKLTAEYQNITISSEVKRDLEGEFTLDLLLSDLSSNDNPTYTINMILDEKDQYKTNLTFGTLEEDGKIEKELSDIEKIVYTLIRGENGNLLIKVEKIETPPETKIINIDVVQDNQTNDYCMIVSGTCVNIESIELTCESTSSQATIQNGEFEIIYDLSRLQSSPVAKYFMLVVDSVEEIIDYSEDFELKEKYAFTDGNNKITYEFKNENGIFALYKDSAQIEVYTCTITDITVNEYIFTVNGTCNNVDSCYVVFECGNRQIFGSQGINIDNLYRFTTQINLTELNFTDNITNIDVYLYINDIKTEINNIYFANNEVSYAGENCLYKYTFTDDETVKIVVEKSELLLPEVTVTNITMENNTIKIDGTYSNIDAFNIKIKKGDLDIENLLPEKEDGNFTIIYDALILDEGDYIFFVTYENQDNAIDNLSELNRVYKINYDLNNKKVYTLSGQENLTLRISFETILQPQIVVNEANIYSDNGQYYITVKGTVENTSELYLKVFEKQSLNFTESGDFELSLNITDIPQNQYFDVYFSYKGINQDSIEQIMFIDISDGIIESKIYSFYGAENILYSYEVNKEETNNYLAIRLTTSSYEMTYTINSVEIDENEILTVSGILFGIEKMQIQIGLLLSDNANIESGNFEVSFDLKRINPDGMRQNVFLKTDFNIENIKDIALAKDEYTREFERAVYTVKVFYGNQNEIILAREEDKTEVAEFTINEITFEDMLITLNGEYFGEGDIALAFDDGTNKYDTENITDYTENIFESTINCENLQINKTYTLKLYVSEQNYYYSVLTDMDIDIEQEFDFDQDNKIVYNLTKNSNNIVELTIKKVLLYDKEVNIESIQLKNVENNPYLLVKGNLRNVSQIKLVSEDLEVDGVIEEDEFTITLDLLTITVAGKYTFEIYFDNIQLDFNSGTQSLIYTVSSSLVNDYSFENATNKIELYYTQNQNLDERLEINSVSLDSNNLVVSVNIENADSIQILTNVSNGTSINEPSGNQNLSIDLKSIMVTGTYNILINTNNQSYYLEYELGQNLVYTYQDDTTTHTYTIKNAKNSIRVVIEYTAKERIVYGIDISSAYINSDENGYKLYIRVNTINITNISIKIGEFASQNYIVGQNNITLMMFDMSTITSYNVNLPIQIYSEDYSINFVNDNYILTENTYTKVVEDCLIRYIFVENGNKELSIKLETSELIYPEVDNISVVFERKSGSVKLNIEGTYENAEDVIINIYNGNNIKNILYPTIENGNFIADLEIVSYENGIYGIEIIYSNEYVETKKYLDYSEVEFTNLNYEENNTIYSYTLENQDSKAVIKVEITLKPVLNITNIYLIYNGAPYIYVEGEKQNINSFIIYCGEDQFESVSENGLNFTKRYNLTNIELERDISFSYSINSGNTTDITNDALTINRVDYTTDSYEYHITAKVVENSDILYVYKTRDEIDNSYTINSVYVRQTDSKTTLVVDLNYGGDESDIKVYIITPIDNYNFRYTVDNKNYVFEYDLDSGEISYFDDHAILSVKLNDEYTPIDFDYYTGEKTSYEIIVYGMNHSVEFSDNNGLYMTITLIEEE